MKVTYYPGCSLESTARDYAILSVRLRPWISNCSIFHWNCCGATAAHSINHRASIDLPGRNLDLLKHSIIPTCWCLARLLFNRLKTAVHELKDNGHRFEATLDLDVPKIWDLANFFASDDNLQKLASGIKRLLKGLEVVSYYGCMASRPPEITGATQYESPKYRQDRENFGRKPFDWPYKTDCCGASLMISMPDMGFKMVGKLLIWPTGWGRGSWFLPDVSGKS